MKFIKWLMAGVTLAYVANLIEERWRKQRYTGCSFDGCNDEAIGRFWFDQGCAALPEEHFQSLCLHHTYRSQPIAQMVLLEDYTLNRALTIERAMPRAA